MAIRGVLWDVDDTIFNYSGADAAAILHHLTAEGLIGAFESAEHAVGVWRAAVNGGYGRFVRGEVTFQEHRRERVRTFLGKPLADAEADAWFEGYERRYELAWQAFPDVLPTLDALADGYRHGLLSNSSAAHQERKLRRLGLRERFSCLVCAAELGHAKPAPEAFLAACEALGLPPGEVAYVGDSPGTDARGADEAGLLGVWLDRTGSGPADWPGLRRITGLGQLAGVLRGDTRFGAPSRIG